MLFRLYFLTIVLVLISGAIPFSLIGFLDEFLLVLCVIVLLPFYYNSMNPAGRSFVVLIFLFYIFSIINFFQSEYRGSFHWMTLQSFVYFKGLILTFVFILFLKVRKDHNKQDRSLVNRVINGLFLLLVLTSLINIIFPAQWVDFLDVPIRFREGRIRLNGFFNSGGSFAYFVSFYVTLVWLVKRKRKVLDRPVYEMFYLFIIILSATAVFTYRKILAISVFTFIVFFFELPRKHKVFVFSIIVVSIPFLLIMTPDLASNGLYEMTVDDLSKFNHSEHYYIRGRMFYHGIQLAIENFPFGTSLGTFGSLASLSNGDGELYYRFGLGHWYREGYGIYDSMIGSITGEAGFVGLLIFGLVVFSFYKSIIVQLSPYYQVLFKVVFLFVVFSFFLGPIIQDGIGAVLLTVFVGYIFVNGYEQVTS